MDDTTQLSALIEQAPGLKSLELLFYGDGTDNYDWENPDIGEVLNESQFQNLSTLKLDFVTCNQTDLRRILEKLEDTLRSLNLGGVCFKIRPDDDADDSGSWLGFFTFLHQSMALTKMEFNNRLSSYAPENEVYEEWDLWRCFCGHPDLNHDICLKHQIEQYIVSGSPYPFTPRKVEERLEIGLDDNTEFQYDKDTLPWAFDPDPSFVLVRYRSVDVDMGIFDK